MEGLRRAKMRGRVTSAQQTTSPRRHNRRRRGANRNQIVSEQARSNSVRGGDGPTARCSTRTDAGRDVLSTSATRAITSGSASRTGGAVGAAGRSPEMTVAQDEASASRCELLGFDESSPVHALQWPRTTDAVAGGILAALVSVHASAHGQTPTANVTARVSRKTSGRINTGQSVAFRERTGQSNAHGRCSHRSGRSGCDGLREGAPPKV